MKNYYETLGIDKTATAEEIKKAYRKKALQYHPDRNKDKEAEDMFKEIGSAYEVLKDPVKKEKYDHGGNNDPWSSGFDGFSDGFDEDIADVIFNKGRRTNKNRNNYSDANYGFGEWGDFFGDRKRKRATKGSNIMQEIYITLRDSIFTLEADINIESSIPCSRCNHTGKTDGKYCYDCTGTGEIKQEKTLHFKGPAGIMDNTVIRLEGQGNCGKNGGEAGDVFLRIKITKDKIFTRLLDDVHCSQEISFIDAILGTTLKVHTIYGKTVKVKVQPGLQPGSVCTIVCQGFPHMRNNNIKGDMKIRIKVVLPKTITEEQANLLKKYRNTL